MNDNKKLSWTAVLTGGIAGVGLNFLLNLLSLAIGLSIFTVSNRLSVLSLFFFGVLAFIAMFTTGWIAGILSNINVNKKMWGVLYGFIAWCVSFIFTVILLTNMIQFASFHSNFTSNELVAVRITNESPMTTETKKAKVDLSTKTISLNVYVTFFLFGIGALSSCIGGYVGFTPLAYKRTEK